MKNKFRKLFRVLIWIITLFISLWLLVWGYVILNKKDLISQVNAELTSKVKGEIKINDLEPSLLSTFPNVSIRLSGVTVRDSLWPQHHHDLLKAERMFIRLTLFSLFSGSPEISKVIVENGSVLIFSDSSGYSNEYMFQSNKRVPASSTSNSNSAVPDIELKNVTLKLDLKDRDKLYDFDISTLKCDIKSKGTTLKMDVRMNLLVHDLAFNLERGSFVKGKPIRGKIALNFDREQKKLSFSNINLNIDKQDFNFTGMFDFSGKPPLYYLAIKTKNVQYAKASLLLPKNISKKLDSFAVEKPIDVTAIIDGSKVPNRMPLVNVDVKIKNNNISTPVGNFTDVTVSGHFGNQVKTSEPKSDANSGFSFTNCSGNWENIPLKSNKLSINNLNHPMMDCDFHSAFNLEKLNDALGTNTIEFTTGWVMADVSFHGALMKSDTNAANIFGTVNLTDASIKYLPRNLTFTRCSGSLVFDDKNFYVKQLKSNIGETDLLMNGAVKNLTSLLDKSPEKAVLNWNISSPKIVLGDFTSFLNKRSTTGTPKKSSKKLLKMANQVDKLLNDCNVELQLNADRLIYKKFNGEKLVANLQLTDKLLSINKVSIEHAGGTLLLNGSLTQGVAQNYIKLSSNMNNVDVTKVFTAFNNFGQDGIIDKNLRGRLSADINISGAITTKAEIEQNTLKGVIDLRLRDGELIDFEPVKQISQTAFKSRDFSNIKFADLIEKLEINGSEIKVNRMEIQSTVFTMFVEGIYDVKKGTDIGIQIPFSNLAKRGADFELKNKGVNSKTGMSINLRAKTGEDGKAKISWDPFKKALKNKDKSASFEKSATDSTDTKRSRRRR